MRLTDLTAVRLLEGDRTGEFGPVEVTGQVLERARRIQPEVNALARARESRARRRRGEPAATAVLRHPPGGRNRRSGQGTSPGPGETVTNRPAGRTGVHSRITSG
ncbi:hypothetical protein GCM10010236_38390 [Streptomyces eurythermus]|nr:hypothetical protein GCM10010236_38390 [Streptomyces eurythermus]